MTELSVSVVIVSHDRPVELELCLKALTYQFRRNFEIIVVHDTKSKAGLIASGLADEVKSVCYEVPNISGARNIGIGLASGDVIAFIDDDAIAEPTWLQRLIEPFSDPNVAAAGGFVIGRNGFDVQWAGEVVDDYGNATSLAVSEATTIEPTQNAYAKTHGTNCAFRREVLQEFGGFDENYHFFLDETDLNIRLGKAGKSVALVPAAEVQHKFAPSRHRQRSRAPKSLFEIGASTGYFLKKYQLSDDHLKSVRASQWRRLQRFVVTGELEPRDVRRIITTFDKGVSDGQSRTLIDRPVSLGGADKFRSFRPYSKPKSTKYHSCRRLIPMDARQQAARSAANGDITTLFVFSWTSLRHQRWFHSDGYWVQTGGLFGKSDRSQKVFSAHTLASRTRKETDALVCKRGVQTPL